MSLIQAPSTPRSVEVARATPCLMASSKPVSETALSSVTLATDISPPWPWLAYCFPEPLLPAPAENKRPLTGTLGSERSLGNIHKIVRQLRARSSSLTHDAHSASQRKQTADQLKC